MPEISATTSKIQFAFFREQLLDVNTFPSKIRPNSDFTLVVNKCPSCCEISISVLTNDIDGTEYCAWVRPKAIYKHYPNYIPKQIRDDYKEACSILNLSPKASATLSRRCLQGMIRNSWPGVTPGKLFDEIQQLQGKISVSQWEAIDALRSLGNIGAHMEKDVNLIVDIEAQEADKLIKLIEVLIEDWYIAKHRNENLYEDIKAVSQDKKIQRKNQL